MPLYEYQCDACGERFEVIQKYSEVTEACTRCSRGPVRRLKSSPAIQFKGSGFYINDYAPKGKSGSDGASSGNAEGKSDAGEKSAAATDKGETKKSDSGSGAAPATADSAAAAPAPKATTAKE
jgi:putative FmdB family regulatory protein